MGAPPVFCIWADKSGLRKPETALAYGMLLNGLEFLVQLLQMGLQISGLGEGCQLPQGQPAHQLHLGVLGCALAELVQNGCCRRIQKVC